MKICARNSFTTRRDYKNSFTTRRDYKNSFTTIPFDSDAYLIEFNVSVHHTVVLGIKLKCDDVVYILQRKLLDVARVPEVDPHNRLALGNLRQK